jgi:hypothetical protein
MGTARLKAQQLTSPHLCRQTAAAHSVLRWSSLSLGRVGCASRGSAPRLALLAIDRTSACGLPAANSTVLKMDGRALRCAGSRTHGAVLPELEPGSLCIARVAYRQLYLRDAAARRRRPGAGTSTPLLGVVTLGRTQCEVIAVTPGWP